jgi:hypothetical protein
MVQLMAGPVAFATGFFGHNQSARKSSFYGFFDYLFHKYDVNEYVKYDRADHRYFHGASRDMKASSSRNLTICSWSGTANQPAITRMSMTRG